jgi:uncharacterized cupin superfamily protein
VGEAGLVETEGGLEPEGEGWFVVNVRDASWWRHDAFGSTCRFENREALPFPDFGLNIRVLQPGQPNCRYHGESGQEAYLVLHGECLLLVEGEERLLRAWDFVHLPAGTEHVAVGAGAEPCAILMVGARQADQALLYPVSELALKHGAGVERETTQPSEAYAEFDPPVRARLDEPRLPWNGAGAL